MIRSASFSLRECAHEVHELPEGELATGAEIIEDHLDQPRGDRIGAELRHSAEIVGVQVPLVALNFAASVAIELVKARPQRADLSLRQTCSGGAKRKQRD